MRVDRHRFIGLSTSAAAGFALLPAPAPAAQFQYKIGFDLPKTHAIGVAITEFANDVKRESGGRMEIQVFPDNTLGSDTSMVSQLRAGALEMSLQSSGPLSAVSPIAGIERVGFAFPNRKAALAGMDGDVGKIIRKDLATKGIVALEKAWEAGYRQLTNSRGPIRNVDDLAGAKIRIPVSAISTDLFKTLGASPIPISSDELYSALQTHIVDAADGTLINIQAERLNEVQKYLSISNHQWSSYYMIFAEKAWNALPPDLQTTVHRLSNAAGLRENHVAGPQNDATADVLHRLGMQVNVTDTSTFRKRLSPFYTRWKNEYGPVAWSALEEYCGKLG